MKKKHGKEEIMMMTREKRKFKLENNRKNRKRGTYDIIRIKITRTKMKRNNFKK